MNQPTQLRGRARAAWRRTRAVELVLQGCDYDEIADELGYKNRSSAWRAVQQSLKARAIDGVDEYRSVAMARLEKVLAAHWTAATSGDVKSAALVLQTIAAECRLLGLDQIEEATTSPGTVIVDSESVEYRDAMAQFAAGTAGR